MTWLAENWIWVLFGLAFIAMHLFGHGGPKKAPAEPADGSRPTVSADTTDSHRH